MVASAVTRGIGFEDGAWKSISRHLLLFQSRLLFPWGVHVNPNRTVCRNMKTEIVLLFGFTLCLRACY